MKTAAWGVKLVTNFLNCTKGVSRGITTYGIGGFTDPTSNRTTKFVNVKSKVHWSYNTV